MSTVIQLIKPIKVHGAEVSEITLGDIVTKDIMELGLPTLIIPSADGKSAGLEIRQSLIAQYVIRKGQVQRSSLEAMELADWGKCQAWCMSFFDMGGGEETNAPSSD